MYRVVLGLMNPMNKFPLIRMITAMTPERGIGFRGKLPWEACGVRIPEDMNHFKTLTCGGLYQRNAVLMGHTTWKSLPSTKKPLPHRTNYVLSTQKNSTTTYTMNTIYECIEHAIATKHDMIWVIGGESVYKQFLEKHLIHDIWITVVHNKYPVDCFFPEIPSYKKTHSYSVQESPISYIKPYNNSSKERIHPPIHPSIPLTFERWEPI